MSRTIFVSPCLLGQKVRWDARESAADASPFSRFLAAGGRIVTLCPECAAGMPTPRPPCEIQGERGGDGVLLGLARVVSSKGEDKTLEYLSGAREALSLCLANGVKVAILKNGSPSCGCSRIYDGSFSGQKIPGSGVTASLLAQSGISVFGEERLVEALAAALAPEKASGCYCHPD